MNVNNILDMIGDAKGEYIRDARQMRAETKKRLSLRQTWLVAAVIALMLLLVGCVAYSQGWFVNFFSARSGAPLSHSQLSFIAENEQQINETQSQNGWTVELRSAMKDGNKAIMILGFTAPEGTDLTREPVDGIYKERIELCNEGLPIDMLVWPKGVELSTYSTNWQEDGDGLDNTMNYVIEIEPNLTKSTVEPFGPDAVWTIRFRQVVLVWTDEEYEQELLNTKYKGEYGVVFTHEETQRLRQEKILAEGDWEFTVTFAGQTDSAQVRELLTAPIQLEADILRRYGELIWETAHFREDITVTSVQLQPLSVRIAYEDCNGSPMLWFSDENLFVEEDIYPSAVMKDGTVITLHARASGSDSYVLLEADAPVIWEEADHLLFADGTKVYMDGSVEMPEKEAPPAAADAYRDVDSESGVYAYYADFDGDGINDLAVWYDGAFHALCLLNEQGECKKEFTFENGMDVYETYNQRAEEIKWEPNQIRILETEGDASTVSFFRATSEGLVLSAAVKQDPAAEEEYLLIGDAETVVSISRAEFQMIVEDYQVMQYRLRPIV